MFNLNNQNVLITGGLGHLGFSMTKALLKQGANVLIFSELFLSSIDLFLLLILAFIPINLSNSIIVNISFTKGTFVNSTEFANKEPAKIGNVAFLEPEMNMFPVRLFFPLIISFCIKEILYSR